MTPANKAPALPKIPPEKLVDLFHRAAEDPALSTEMRMMSVWMESALGWLVLLARGQSRVVRLLTEARKLVEKEAAAPAPAPAAPPPPALEPEEGEPGPEGGAVDADALAAQMRREMEAEAAAEEAKPPAPPAPRPVPMRPPTKKAPRKAEGAQ